MRKDVVLSLRGQQNYVDQEPEIIELVTEGTLESTERGWIIRYEESDLMGLSGVTTEFSVEPEQVELKRTGKLNSHMVFREGVHHDSLYQLEFGALMITVCANKIRSDLTENGGTVDLVYGIEIEQTAAGQVDYHLDVKVKNA